MNSQPPRRLGIQPFDRAMIQDFLERKEMPFTTDADGDFSLTMRLTADGTEGGLDLALFLMAIGTNGEIFSVRGTANAPVPEEFFAPMAVTCNRWNSQSTFSKAFLITEETAESEPTVGRIIVEQSIPLEPGISQLQLDDLAHHAVNGVVSFWSWMVNEGVIQLSANPPESAE